MCQFLGDIVVFGKVVWKVRPIFQVLVADFIPSAAALGLRASFRQS